MKEKKHTTTGDDLLKGAIGRENRGTNDQPFLSGLSGNHRHHLRKSVTEGEEAWRLHAEQQQVVGDHGNVGGGGAKKREQSPNAGGGSGITAKLFDFEPVERLSHESGVWRIGMG